MTTISNVLRAATITVGQTDDPGGTPFRTGQTVALMRNERVREYGKVVRTWDGGIEVVMTSPVSYQVGDYFVARGETMSKSTVRCQKCGHTGVPSPTVVLDLEEEIRGLREALRILLLERDSLADRVNGESQHKPQTPTNGLNAVFGKWPIAESGQELYERTKDE